MSSAVSLKVGFIGLGRIGQAMAARILGAGHDLVVYNRTVAKTMDLANAGALAATSVAGACEAREIVITMVTDDASLQSVTLGAGGIRESLAPGAIHLSMGTHGVGVIQKLAAAIQAHQLIGSQVDTTSYQANSGASNCAALRANRRFAVEA